MPNKFSLKMHHEVTWVQELTFITSNTRKMSDSKQSSSIEQTADRIHKAYLQEKRYQERLELELSKSKLLILEKNGRIITIPGLGKH